MLHYLIACFIALIACSMMPPQERALIYEKMGTPLDALVRETVQTTLTLRELCRKFGLAEASLERLGEEPAPRTLSPRYSPRMQSPCHLRTLSRPAPRACNLRAPSRPAPRARECARAGELCRRAPPLHASTPASPRCASCGRGA